MSEKKEEYKIGSHRLFFIVGAVVVFSALAIGTFMILGEANHCLGFVDAERLDGHYGTATAIEAMWNAVRNTTMIIWLGAIVGFIITGLSLMKRK
jgi:hypothetical protein